MNARWTIFLAAFAAALSAERAVATAATPIIGPNQVAVQGSATIIQDSTLMGSTVVNPQGQKLGRIKDVLLDAQNGQATFVVLDADAGASGHAMLVVPFRALWVSVNPVDHRQTVVLDLRPDQFHAAPQIKNDQWQMLQSPQFLDQARDFYQVGTYTAARPIEEMSPPSLPPPCPVTQPYANSGDDLPPDLEEFYNE